MDQQQLIIWILVGAMVLQVLSWLAVLLAASALMQRAKAILSNVDQMTDNLRAESAKRNAWARVIIAAWQMRRRKEAK